MYRFAPGGPWNVPRLGINAAGVYDVDPADVDALNARIPGIDGALAFVAVGDGEALVALPNPSAPKPKPASAKPSRR